MYNTVTLRLLLFGLVFLSACIRQPVDPTADLPVISYQMEVSPIISANCALSGCHAANDREFPLTNYDEVMENCSVTPGKPHDSELYEVIRLYTGERAMPPTPNEPLTDEQIGTIYVWILQGAKNN